MKENPTIVDDGGGGGGGVLLLLLPMMVPVLDDRLEYLWHRVWGIWIGGVFY